MNKINSLFANSKDRKLLSLYFCAGAPTLDSTADTILTMQAKGISMIEVGIPFSDPMADGPVIQEAATTALKNGMSLRLLFQQLKAIKEQVHIPLVLMGYLNPIMQYGIDAFCQSCVESGVSGVIIPDLPFDDYLENVKPAADKYDIRIIMLITPETSEERIRFIDEHTDGFIYMVSSAATTGAQQSFDEQTQPVVRLETEAKLRIQHLMRTGVVEYAWSKVLDYELGQSPYFDQTDEICDWVDWAAVYVEMDDSIAADGAAIMRYGVKRMDALHLASAKAAGCDWFLTTDRGILKHIGSLDGMRVANPVDFAMEDES